MTYKRELNHSYMVICCENADITLKYSYRMMSANHIGKLLDCSQRQLDGRTYLYYDISSRQPLERLYESRKMGVEEIWEILHSIAAIQEDLGEYLLDEQGLLLEAGQMFADVETEEIYFCFYPGQEQDVHRYARLADFFLEHVDHGQEHAVNAAYRFYSMSKADYFVLNSFFPFLEKERNAWKQETAQKAEELNVGEVVLPPQRDVLWDFDEPDEVQEKTENKKDIRQRNKKRKKRRGLLGIFRFTGSVDADDSEKGAEPQQWSETVWDSYIKQTDYSGTGETLYFTNLEQPDKGNVGIPCLYEENGDRKFLLENLPVTVGKLRGKVSVVLEDSSVSRMHARFENGPGGTLFICDLNSKNGTLLNGEKLLPNESAAIRDGDLVQFGRERFRYGFVDSKALK